MSTHTRDGFALPAALLAILIIGALVTGGTYAAMAESRASGSADYGEKAFMAAERGLEAVLGTKNRIYFEDSVGVVGMADTIGPVSLQLGDVDAQYTLYVQRLSTLLFKVDSEGQVISGGRFNGSRRISGLMRITHTYVPMDRAVTSYGPLRMRGTSGVSGVDSMPAGWSDPACTDVGTQAAVQAHTDDSKYIDIKGAAGMDGSPQVRVDATMDSADFISYGDMQLDNLKEYANVTLSNGTTVNGMAPSTTAGGTCNEADPNNWGDPHDPAGACHTYWPIIYAQGDLSITNGSGQGILIVDGDLKATGSFDFTGIVFVYGGLSMTGNGNHFAGSVNIYANGDTTEIDNKGAGSSSITLSSCAIERAHRYNDRFSRPIPLAMRRFVDLSGVGAD